MEEKAIRRFFRERKARSADDFRKLFNGECKILIFYIVPVIVVNIMVPALSESLIETVEVPGGKFMFRFCPVAWWQRKLSRFSSKRRS